MGLSDKQKPARKGLLLARVIEIIF